ncbi:CAAX prenyl protease-related protein [Botrimarina hoheduenensis]|uniref:CAAX amino terminal protease self-immunity n=1 Tax=Botrimarina hoheduenensis TaxID=2528000 RepID=A0A5C5W925_9BACT|nr:CAAX prenyl protease-related protein [Botrimarina hoheduenensis]TWT47386.1 CAAX amino terminal protease self- immunity [Botrimarina hoheduenensis]
MSPPPSTDPPAEPVPGTLGIRALASDSTWPYVLPMAVYLLLSSLEPSAPAPGEAARANSWGFTYADYPALYTTKLALTALALWLGAAAWRQWRLRVSPLAIVVGVVGVVAWIGCCKLGLEGRLMATLGPESLVAKFLQMLGLGVERPAFNPFEQLEGSPAYRNGFLAVRFLGLVVLVPLFEELLLRGWLMRNVVSPNFWRVPFGRVTVQAALVGTAFPMLYHPEKLAALVWFSLVTLLMVRTKNYWDCVAAHAVTNLLLGLYVVQTGSWELW